MINLLSETTIVSSKIHKGLLNTMMYAALIQLIKKKLSFLKMMMNLVGIISQKSINAMTISSSNLINLSTGGLDKHAKQLDKTINSTHAAQMLTARLKLFMFSWRIKFTTYVWQKIVELLQMWMPWFGMLFLKLLPLGTLITISLVIQCCLSIILRITGLMLILQELRLFPIMNQKDLGHY